jgi:hypothetical protein
MYKAIATSVPDSAKLSPLYEKPIYLPNKYMPMGVEAAYCMLSIFTRTQ